LGKGCAIRIGGWGTPARNIAWFGGGEVNLEKNAGEGDDRKGEGGRDQVKRGKREIIEKRKGGTKCEGIGSRRPAKKNPGRGTRTKKKIKQSEEGGGSRGPKKFRWESDRGVRRQEERN